MSKIKVCFIISSLRKGGAERVVSLLANQLSSFQGYDVDIVSVNDAQPAYYFSGDTVLHNLSILNNKGFLLNSVERIFKTVRKIKEINPDVIISFMTATNCESIVAAKILRKPIIISERSNPSFSCVNVFWKLFRRLSYPLANKLICQTKGSMNFYSWVKHKQVIYNPVKEISVRPEKNTSSSVVLSVGTLKKEKNYSALIHAFNEALNSHSIREWKLVIVGDGPERAHLEQLITDLDMNGTVVLPGAVDDVDSFYSSAAMFVLSSNYEGMPNVLIEAITHGVPCISFDCDYGPSEILADDVGLLVENGNVNLLANAIAKLMGEKQIRESLSYKSKARAKCFSLESITSQWVDAIDEVINK